MSNPFDGIDAWLGAPVEPLDPPPGTFQRIHRRARRRKAGKLLTSAAGVIIVIAAAVTVPAVVSGRHGQPGLAGKPSALGTQASTSKSRVASGHGGTSASPPTGSKVGLRPSALSATGSGTAAPDNFEPTSVTFVSPDIGAIIGQAGTPGHCATRFCTSLAGTSDDGGTWYGINAPVTGPPDGSAGVSQIRFLNMRDGWAFGPALWVTHDGGASWTQEPTSGMRVADLEAAGDRAFALFASCTGSGSDYGSDCTSFSLYSSAAGSDQWAQVPGAAASLPVPDGKAGSAGLVLTASRGYLLAPSGQLLSGPLTGAAWTLELDLPCRPGTPGPAGQPTAALLAAAGSQLTLVCTGTEPGADSQAVQVFQSANQGAPWLVQGDAVVAGIAASLAAEPGGLLLATDAGIFRSANGATWKQVQASPAGAAAGQAGFSYVGMTSLQNGVALPADPGLHEVFITSDGGSTWEPRQVSGP